MDNHLSHWNYRDPHQYCYNPLGHHQNSLKWKKSGEPHDTKPSTLRPYLPFGGIIGFTTFHPATLVILILFFHQPIKPIITDNYRAIYTMCTSSTVQHYSFIVQWTPWASASSSFSFFRPSPSPGPGMSLMQRILLFVLSYIHYIISYIYNVYGISVYIYKYSTIHLYIISHHNHHHPKRHVTASFCFIFRRLRMRWHMHLAGIHLGWWKNPTHLLLVNIWLLYGLWWLIIWLVVSTYPSEKSWSESQLGWWTSQLNGKNHVPNHQPVVVFSTVVDHSGSMNTIRQTNDRELTVEYVGPWIQMRSAGPRTS